MSESAIRILVVDDHPMIRKGLASVINPEPDMRVVASVASGPEAIEFYREHRPDVTIMDLTLTPGMTGIDAIEAIRKEDPTARIIVLSAYKGDQDIHRALQAGAITYLLKETLGDDLIPIIREVSTGGGPIPPLVARKLADRLRQSELSAREIEVLKLISDGLRNKEIAAKLGISAQTIQGHVKNIMAKLQVHDRTEAVTLALKRGIIHLDT